jgi:predicted unusual protein kinase regulating ubiquinone biosynthesis (AarF/ABC1/UbiB family)
MTQPRGPQPPVYDPDRLALEAEAQGAEFRDRTWGFALSLVGFALWVAWLWLSGNRTRTQVAFACWARQAMVRQGAVFIKLGQMLSTRVDAFSQEVLTELSHLQDKVPPFPFEYVRETVEADLGGPLSDLFASFDPTPLAAASLGQVHPARLRTGEDIVVKVLRPGLEGRFSMDLTLLRRCAQWMTRHPRIILFLGGSPSTPWVQLVDRLGVSCYQQLDLWVEGLHGEKFARNFASQPRVTSPAIYWSHSSTRVLAQERVYGFRFDDEAAIRAAGIDYIEMAEVGIRAFTKQIFEDAFFHADTHPGNIFVTQDSRLVYLDFGMVEYIDDKFQAELVEMFVHIIQQDWAGFLNDMVKADIVPPEVDREKLLPIFTDVWSAQLGFTDKRYTLQDVSDRFYSIMREYPFRLPDRFLFLTRTAASMEGVVYRADPSFKFLPIALPFFAKLVLSRIDVENPWIIQDLLAASQNGGAFDRLANLARMALADEPDAASVLATSLIEVLAHPKAQPLRKELADKLLEGGMAGFGTIVPGDIKLTKKATLKLEDFLVSPAGRSWALDVLEDPRFAAFASPLLLGGYLNVDLQLDWGRILMAWFPSNAERRRGTLILHSLLADERFPWASMVDPMTHLGQLQQLQLTRTVGQADSLPTLIGIMVQRGTLPLLARGVLKGWQDRLGMFGGGTRPLTGELGTPP